MEQAQGPVQAAVEMSSTPERTVETLRSIPDYVSMFGEAFPDADPVTFQNMARAIEAFEATLVTPNSPFDLYLGGDDIDQGLARFVSTEVLRTQRWDLQSDPNVFARLLAACETAKIQLSEADEAFIDLLEVDPVAPLMDTTIRLNQSQLASLVAGLTRRTFVLCDEVLSKAGCRASDVDVVFLAGGATHLRVIQEGVEAYFGREVRTDHNPMHVVALGAAQLAHT